MLLRMRRINTNTIIVAATFAATFVICTTIFAKALIRIKNKDEIIRVVGSARKPIQSDLIIWKGRINQSAATIGLAYAELKADSGKVKHYLLAKGVHQAEIFPLAISDETLYAPIKKAKPRSTVIVTNADGTNTDSTSSADINSIATERKVIGHRLTEEIEVRSQQVELVDRIPRESTELISNGMNFESETPQYIYTKLGELKVTMQAEAARDARARADQIAANSGCRVDEVRYARMSVPQITPLYSTQESDGGYDDTSSIDKKITAVVVAGFSIR